MQKTEEMVEHKKANLFVVGAMRAGTTSFMKVLEEHPEVYTAPIKEPHYFITELPEAVYSPSKKFSVAAYFKHDFPKKMHIAQVQSTAHYEKLFSLAGDQKYRVEASTCYLHEPNAASKIKRYNPDAKIIILLRDPLERAYSQYAMNVGLGRENKAFEAVVAKELQQLKEGSLPWHSILNMSCYDPSIARYRQLFKDVCVLTLQGLSRAPKDAFKTSANFLQIAPFQAQFLPKSNEAIHVKNKQLVYRLKKSGLKGFASNVLGANAKHKILRVLSQGNSEPLISTELKLQLDTFFMMHSKVYLELIQHSD